MTKDKLLEMVKKANIDNWNADDVHNALNETIKFLEQPDSKALHIADVSGMLPTCINCGKEMKIYAYECKCGMTKLAE